MGRVNQLSGDALTEVAEAMAVAASVAAAFVAVVLVAALPSFWAFAARIAAWAMIVASGEPETIEGASPEDAADAGVAA